MNRILLVLLMGVAFSILSATELSIQPGELSSKMDNNKSETTLVLNGSMDVRDFKFINEQLQNLSMLDISKIKIEKFSGDTAYFGEQLTYAENELPLYCFFGSKLSNVVLPISLTSIGEGSFSNCKALQNIILPENLDSIGNSAFYDCDALATIEIPAKVSSLGDYAFAECDNLANMDIKSNASGFVIPSYLFRNCKSLSTISFPSQTVTIGDGAFIGCDALTSFAFPASLTQIGTDAFKGVSMAYIDLSPSSNLKSIGDWAFADNLVLVSIKLPNGITSIGNGAFFMASALEDIVLPHELSTISDFLVTGCEKVSRTEIIPTGTTKIGKFAFADWTGMISYEVPASVNYIDDNAFENNSNLKDIRIHSTEVPELGKTVFKGVDQPNTKLKVEEGMVEPFKSADQWKEFQIEVYTSVETKPEVTSNIKAYFNGTLLLVEAPKEILETLLYDVNGKELTRKVSKSDRVSIETSDFNGNFYIVAGKLSDGSKFSIKLVRR